MIVKTDCETDGTSASLDTLDTRQCIRFDSIDSDISHVSRAGDLCPRLLLRGGEREVAEPPVHLRPQLPPQVRDLSLVLHLDTDTQYEYRYLYTDI